VKLVNKTKRSTSSDVLFISIKFRITYDLRISSNHSFPRLFELVFGNMILTYKILKRKKWGRRRPHTSIFVLITPTVFKKQGIEISIKKTPLIKVKYCSERAVRGRLNFQSKQTF